MSDLMTDLLDIMTRFRRAYANADRAELLAVTTEDFEWHQHCGVGPGDLPNGRILLGVDPLLEEIEWRRTHWQDVSYEGLEERAAGADLLVQTFTISGKQDGIDFLAKAVDLYPVRSGLIARKDTYWKYAR